jgi:hypothetical protein
MPCLFGQNRAIRHASQAAFWTTFLDYEELRPANGDAGVSSDKAWSIKQTARRHVPRKDPDEANRRFMFRRFRFQVIDFLRLPADVSESTLRNAIESASPNLLAIYDERAARVKPARAPRERPRASRE